MSLKSVNDDRKVSRIVGEIDMLAELLESLPSYIKDFPISNFSDKENIFSEIGTLKRSREEFKKNLTDQSAEASLKQLENKSSIIITVLIKAIRNRTMMVVEKTGKDEPESIMELVENLAKLTANFSHLISSEDYQTILKKFSETCKEFLSQQNNYEEQLGDPLYVHKPPPETLELEDPRLEFISIDKYSAARDKIQATKDWLRNAPKITLNGISLAEIVRDIKLKNFKEKIKDFINEDLIQESNHEKDLKDLIILVLKANQHAINEKEIDLINLEAPYLSTFFDILVEEGFDLEKDEKNQKKYDLTNISRPLLKFLNKDVGAYLSAAYAADEKNQNLLESIWKEYLFKNISSQNREEFTKLFFQYAHQGGFMYSLITAHQAHFNKCWPPMDGKYLFVAQKGLEEVMTHFSAVNNQISVIEKTPISGFFLGENIGTDLFANKSITDLEIKHVIKMTDGEAKLNIEYARSKLDEKKMADNFDSSQLLYGRKFLENARELRRKDLYAHIMAYANSYISEGGHNAERLKELMEKFPEFAKDLKQTKTEKNLNLIQRLLPGQEAHHQGDKFLSYLAKAYPDFANGIVKKIEQTIFTDDKEHFERSMKLLVRMGNHENAIEFVRSLIQAKVNENPQYLNILNEFDKNPNKDRAFFFRKTYEDLVKIGVIPTKEDDLKNYTEDFIQNGHTEINQDNLLNILKKHHLFTGHIDAFFSSTHRNTGEKSDLVFTCLGKENKKYARELLNKLDTYDREPFQRAVHVLVKLNKEKEVKKFLEGKLKEIKWLSHEKDPMKGKTLMEVYQILREQNLIEPPLIEQKKSSLKS